MEKNEEMKEKIEKRYVDGVGGIRSAKKIELVEEKKNFGGKGASGSKDKGIKNAKVGVCVYFHGARPGGSWCVDPPYVGT